MTEATLAAGTIIAKDDGAMDFIANATGAIFAEGWTPELQQHGRRPAGLPTACSRRCRPNTRRNFRAERRRNVHSIAGSMTGSSRPARTQVRGAARRSRSRGLPLGWRGPSSPPPSLFYAAFVLVADRHDRSTTRCCDWDGIGPSQFGGPANYVTVLTDPDLLAVIGNAFQLILYFT